MVAKTLPITYVAPMHRPPNRRRLVVEEEVCERMVFQRADIGEVVMVMAVAPPPKKNRLHQPELAEAARGCLWLRHTPVSPTRHPRPLG